jgi:hypothetical protein
MSIFFVNQNINSIRGPNHGWETTYPAPRLPRHHHRAGINTKISFFLYFLYSLLGCKSVCIWGSVSLHRYGLVMQALCTISCRTCSSTLCLEPVAKDEAKQVIVQMAGEIGKPFSTSKFVHAAITRLFASSLASRTCSESFCVKRHVVGCPRLP